jgi:hypothetical protein
MYNVSLTQIYSENFVKGLRKPNIELITKYLQP